MNRNDQLDALTYSLEALSRRNSDGKIPINISLVDQEAFEAEFSKIAENLGINDKGTPMRIGWCNDEVIERN